MCGIVGYVGSQEATSILVEGLRRLEYRGYDSAGVAILNGNGVDVRRRVGKLAVLENDLIAQPIRGTLGVGHTRWATHGRPSEDNAHPHTSCQGEIAVVHNGIVENYAELKNHLTSQGHPFKSQTDTEVFAHLIEDAFEGNLVEAVRAALKKVRGSYALAVISGRDPQRLVVARKDSPLVLGLGEGEMFVASDVPALLPYTREVVFLQDGEMAELTPERVNVFSAGGDLLRPSSQTIHWDAAMAEKGGYAHFMLKEINEQPSSVLRTLGNYVSPERERVCLEDIVPIHTARSISRVCLVGCGTSYHAALVARYWIEELAGIPCDVDMASEYRYRRSSRDPNALWVAITQSGETADTLAALRDAKAQGLSTLALCNVVGSTITREADHALLTFCGPEIGVASTKAFTGQLTAFFLLALYLAQCRRGALDPELQALKTACMDLPKLIRETLEQAPQIEKIAQEFYAAKDFLFLGRHLNYPIALEGALKLKEISYIHAEGYPAGEMKHGPIALIEKGLPVVAIVTESVIREKMLSNIEEVRAREGRVIAVATAGDLDVIKKADAVLTIPRAKEFLTPFLTILPLQLLAYSIACLRGCDVDQPRNLAKSVTVE